MSEDTPRKHPLTDLERLTLAGQTPSDTVLRGFSLGLRERIYGLEALFKNDDLEAIKYLSRSTKNLAPDTLEWAVSERLHGLALIRVQREVEGTFALERADAVLEHFGFGPFEIE
jgi:hypothetical protein